MHVLGERPHSPSIIVNYWARLKIVRKSGMCGRQSSNKRLQSPINKESARSLIILLPFIPSTHLHSLHFRRSCATSSLSSRSSSVRCSRLRHLLDHHRPPFPVYTNAQLKIPPTTLSLRMLKPATPSTANTDRATVYTSRFVVYPSKLCIPSLTIKF